MLKGESYQLRGSIINNSIVQIYVPTDGSTEVKRQRKEEVILFMGDLNGKLGGGSFEGIAGRYVGDGNERGSR